MYSGQDIFAEREKIKRSLDTSLKRAYESGMELAEKTKAYRMIAAQKILQLKADGMQISIIDKVSRGDEEVAQAEFEMIAAEVSYKASMENIQVQKKFFESIEQTIRREIYVGSKE